MSKNNRDKKIPVSNASKQRVLDGICSEKKSNFANRDLYPQFSICRMSRPKGKIFRG